MLEWAGCQHGGDRNSKASGGWRACSAQLGCADLQRADAARMRSGCFSNRVRPAVWGCLSALPPNGTSSEVRDKVKPMSERLWYVRKVGECRRTKLLKLGRLAGSCTVRLDPTRGKPTDWIAICFPGSQKHQNQARDFVSFIKFDLGLRASFIGRAFATPAERNQPKQAGKNNHIATGKTQFRPGRLDVK